MNAYANDPGKDNDSNDGTDDEGTTNNGGDDDDSGNCSYDVDPETGDIED